MLKFKRNDLRKEASKYISKKDDCKILRFLLEKYM